MPDETMKRIMRGVQTAGESITAREKARRTNQDPAFPYDRKNVISRLEHPKGPADRVKELQAARAKIVAKDKNDPRLEAIDRDIKNFGGN